MPSFHSAGTLPVDHTLVMTLCKASLTGFSALFRSSAVMPSAPAARPHYAKTLFSVGSQVIWESSVMKKQMQLQNQHSLNLSLIWSLYPRITKLIFDEWQEVWNCCAENKLHANRPTVGDYKQKTCLSRHDSVLLNRLRIGHTRLTHFFTLRWWLTWMWYLSVPTNCEAHSGWMCWF